VPGAGLVDVDDQQGQEMGQLDGKVAIVTGGSRGIGKAIAAAFAAEGARVIISSRKQPGLDAAAEAINATNPAHPVIPKACHVGKAEQLTELMDWAQADVGMVNVLVNNAATNPYFGPMLGIQDGAWDKTFEVNLKGPFVATRLVAKRLMAAKASGSIVNVASIAGRGAAPMQGVYGMTKAALISMTQTLATELAGAGIRVNAIAPGLIETKLAGAMLGSKQILDRYYDHTSMRRVGQPHELGGAAVFLASDASSYVTGQTLNVDGGYSVN